jgi:hypothetical protein
MDVSESLVQCGQERLGWFGTAHGRPESQDPKGSPCRQGIQRASRDYCLTRNWNPTMGKL